MGLGNPIRRLIWLYWGEVSRILVEDDQEHLELFCLAVLLIGASIGYRGLEIIAMDLVLWKVAGVVALVFSVACGIYCALLLGAIYLKRTRRLKPRTASPVDGSGRRD